MSVIDVIAYVTFGTPMLYTGVLLIKSLGGK